MKHLLLFTIIFMPGSFCFSQKQVEMNQKANKNYEQADKALNDTYQKILTEYKSDIEFIKNLKTAQRAWIQFRDAEMKARYPDREPGYYGSIQPMCWSMYLKELTEERNKKLKRWLTGIEEGDACSGSVKAKASVF